MCTFLVACTLTLSLAAQTRIVGSGNDQITATVRGADGFVYATGITNSPDFPTTIEPAARPTSANDYLSFVLKLDPQGKLIYSTLIAANASSSSIAVNRKGEVLIAGTKRTGPLGFPATPGAVDNGAVNSGFLLKLDATGTRILFGIGGYGQGPVAFDANDNIYVAGSAYGDSPIQPTPGAFQSTHEARACGGTAFLGIGCTYQYVAKISADGTRLIYSTFVTGTYGASPSGLLVDDLGNAIVAGTTNSPDYPVTEGSFQPQYRAAKPPPPPTSIRPSLNAPPVSGYVTKLNATGTALVWSTYFSGTGADMISSLRLAADGGLFFTGMSASRDLPWSTGLTEACPMGIYSPDIPYIAELSADGKNTAGSKYVYDLKRYQETSIRIKPDGSAEILAGEPATVNLDTGSQYLCMVDSADMSRLTALAPGQLVTLFGNFVESASVRFGDQPAQALYASREQINFQVPLTTTAAGDLRVVGPDGSVNPRPFDWVARAPSAFLDLSHPFSGIATCRGYSFSPGYDAIVRNEDGSLNDCDHPAPKGSIVSFYLNGLGATTPAITLPFGEIAGLEQESPGVGRMRIQLPANATSGSFTPVIDGARLRYSSLAVWITP